MQRQALLVAAFCLIVVGCKSRSTVSARTVELYELAASEDSSQRDIDELISLLVSHKAAGKEFLINKFESERVDERRWTSLFLMEKSNLLPSKVTLTRWYQHPDTGELSKSALKRLLETR